MIRQLIHFFGSIARGLLLIMAKFSGVYSRFVIHILVDTSEMKLGGSDCSLTWKLGLFKEDKLLTRNITEGTELELSQKFSAMFDWLVYSRTLEGTIALP